MFPDLTLAAAQIVSLTAAGVVNLDFLADFDIDPDIPNVADILGLGSLLSGPVLLLIGPHPVRFFPICDFCWFGLDGYYNHPFELKCLHIFHRLYKYYEMYFTISLYMKKQ